MTRRRLSLAALIIAAYEAVAPRAQRAADQWFTLKQIAPNVWAVIDNPKAKQRSFSNAGFVIGDDGVVVIETAPL